MKSLYDRLKKADLKKLEAFYKRTDPSFKEPFDKVLKHYSNPLQLTIADCITLTMVFGLADDGRFVNAITEFFKNRK